MQNEGKVYRLSKFSERRSVSSSRAGIQVFSLPTEKA